MCGRYTNRMSWSEIARLYRITEPRGDKAPNLEPRYNVAPTQYVPIVISAPEGRALQMARWGLIPSWAKYTSVGAKMINAWAETVAEKPAFRSAFESRRCLIPADGFYEWHSEGKSKQPFYFRLRDGGGFAFAGLYKLWPDPNAEGFLISCSIVTTEANDVVGLIHDRMPVILHEYDYGPWLAAPPDEAATLMVPYPAEEMLAAPVSRRVNNARNEGPELLEGP